MNSSTISSDPLFGTPPPGSSSRLTSGGRRQDWTDFNAFSVCLTIRVCRCSWMVAGRRGRRREQRRRRGQPTRGLRDKRMRFDVKAHSLGRVVFARIGWMKFYEGSKPGDKRPLRGGSYNRRNIGSELCNFKKRGRWLYGYFETIITPRNKDDGTRLNLGRIDAGAADTNTLTNVLVVFVATSSDVGQVVVGWYRGAEILRHAKARPAPDDNHSYRCRAKITDCVLIPEEKRAERIPTGRGAMGQANVCYPLKADGSPKRARWMIKAVKYVNSYKGPNRLA